MLPAAAAFAVAGIFAFSIIWNDGIPRRVAKSKAQQPGQLSFAGDICNARRSRCAFGDPDSSRIVYLVGDSYAMNLAYGLDVLFAKNGYRGIALFDSGCAFLRDTVTYVKSAPDRRCEENVAATYAQLARDRHPIIFASHYTGYRTILAPKGGQPSDPAESDFAPWFVDRLQADLAAIGGQDRRLIVFKQSYNVGVDLPNCLARPNADISACAARRGDEMRRLSVPFDTALANMQRIFPSLVLVDSKSAFCPTDGTCIVSEGSTLFFRDSAHLTNEGSRFAIDRLSGPILSALQTSPY